MGVLMYICAYGVMRVPRVPGYFVLGGYRHSNTPKGRGVAFLTELDRAGLRRRVYLSVVRDHGVSCLVLTRYRSK